MTYIKKEIEKRGTRTEIENSGFDLAGLYNFKSELLSELKRIEDKDSDDMIYRLEIIYDEILDILDVKYIAGSTSG